MDGPESTFRRPALSPCPRCLAPLKASARYCFNCGADTVDPGDERKEGRWIDATRGVYCPRCGRFNRFMDTFRCSGCWESALCRAHRAGADELLCRRCRRSREEGRPWEDMKEVERLRAEEAPGASETRLLRSIPPEGLVWVPAGEFLMGDDRRRVYLEAFAIDPFLVTHLQFQQFLPQHRFPPEKAHHPVVQVSWYDPERNFKVFKGSCWIDHDLMARCANRTGFEPLHRFGLIGFRCAW